MKVRQPILVALAAMLLLMATASVQAQPVDRALQLDEELEKGIENAVVYVSVEYQKPNSTRRYIESGTGFFVANNHIITNHHVIAPSLTGTSAKLQVRLFSGTREARAYPAQVLKSDPQIDLALLLLDGEVPVVQPLQIHPQAPRRQTEVFGFGFPLGTMLDKSVNGPNVCLRRGYVSRMINDGRNIEADLNIDKGISGGPMVDAEGIVRGVIRAMTGSQYNKSFAAIAVSSTTLLDFCSSAGLAVTLPGAQTQQPAGTMTEAPAQAASPEPVVNGSLSEEIMRGFFSVGTAARLSTLVPRLVLAENLPFAEDLLQSARHNAELLLTNLQKINAPRLLQEQARELSSLLGTPLPDVRDAGDVSASFESACDEWVQEAGEGEQLNYHLAAWLTELSLGCLSSDDQDLQTARYFAAAAEAQDCSAAVVTILRRLQSNLQLRLGQESEDLRRAIIRDADRLIGIGFIPVAS